MFKKLIFILAGISLFYHGLLYADDSVFSGERGYNVQGMYHGVKGYEIQPQPIWQKCGLHHRPCGVYGLPNSYYSDNGFRQKTSGLLEEHH